MEDENFERKVLVGVDGSVANGAALLWAIRESKVRQGELTAAYAWQVPSFVYFSPGSTSHVVAHRSTVPVAIIPSTPEEVSE